MRKLLKRLVFTIGNLLKKLKLPVCITNSSTFAKSVERLNKLMLSKMKQYTTPKQTAKLIELGLPKPRYYSRDKYTIIYTGFDIINYSIGELIEMLPMGINNDGRFEDLIIHPNYHRWVVKYSGIFREPTYQSCMEELVDALYDMAIKLKEEGVI